MKVIYYYYYLFYKKILKDNEPHMLATLALSASEAIFVNISFHIICIKLFCYQTSATIMIFTTVLLIFINYIYFHKTNRAKQIVTNKPSFFSNANLSITITTLFFIITSSFIFWGPEYGKYLLENCK